MSLALQDMSGNVCLIDADANVIEANGDYADLVGRSAASIVGRNISEWVQPGDWPECRRVLDYTVATGAASEFIGTFRRPNGTVAVVVGEMVPLPRSSEGYIVSCNHVIYASTGASDRRKAEVAEYVAALARELARAADRAGLTALGASLRHLTVHAAATLRDLDDDRPAPPLVPGGSTW